MKLKEVPGIWIEMTDLDLVDLRLEDIVVIAKII